MSLPTVATLKAYLKVETTADDAVITTLLATAKAEIADVLGAPLEADDARTFYDVAARRVDGRWMLFVPVMALGSSVTVTDANGETVSTDEYRVDTDAGMITAIDDTAFTNGPYTITASAGLDQGSDYETRVEPIVSGCIMDLVADRYYNRNAGASSESTPGGISTTLRATGMPLRVVERLQRLRRVRIG